MVRESNEGCLRELEAVIFAHAKVPLDDCGGGVREERTYQR